MNGYTARAARVLTIAALPFLLFCSSAQSAHAQSFGVELHNTLMPISGGMGGVSLARPQDVMSALNGNPATLADFYGTRFTTGGAWVEPTYNISHDGAAGLPGLETFSGKSEAEGTALGGFTVTQDFGALGMPATAGLGLFGSSGAGLSFRDIPASNGTTITFQVLQIAVGAGIDVTDNLAVGANLMLGSGTLDGPFIGLTSAAYDYALRGSVGLTYDFGRETTFAAYYQTKQSFNFDDVARLQLTASPGITFGIIRDIPLDLPENIGFAVANESLLNGRLLLATDVLFKRWDNTDLFGALYQNQWVLQLGAQYKYNRRTRLRLGYVYAENPIRPNPGGTAGGISPPGGQDAIYYLQSTLAVINRHRFTFGLGLRDILPGIDVDLFAGFAPRVGQDFGAFTSANVESYWVGTGLTWRFGRGAVERLPIPNDW